MSDVEMVQEEVGMEWQLSQELERFSQATPTEKRASMPQRKKILTRMLATP